MAQEDIPRFYTSKIVAEWLSRELGKHCPGRWDISNELVVRGDYTIPATSDHEEATFLDSVDVGNPQYHGYRVHFIISAYDQVESVKTQIITFTNRRTKAVNINVYYVEIHQMYVVSIGYEPMEGDQGRTNEEIDAMTKPPMVSD